MRILNDSVLFYPATGDVRHENPVPQRAVENARRKPRKVSATPADAALACGVPRIDWDAVLAASDKDIKAFRDAHSVVGKDGRAVGIRSLLEGNTKTSKERPTGRLGRIRGLSLAPHFYPNLLEVIERRSKLRAFDKDLFNGFDGTSATTALAWLKKQDTPADSFVRADKDTALQSMLDFCVGSSPACRMTCLVYSGQNPSTKEAPQSKMKHTWAFLDNPELFVAALRKEMHDKAKSARRAGFDFVVRLNMLSDIPWYVICPELLVEASTEHGVAFYDYTKVVFWGDPAYEAVREHLDLTFSYSGANADLCAQALAAGERVAAAFAPGDPERSASIAHRTTWQELLYSMRAGGLKKGVGRGRPHIDLFGGSWPLVDGDESDYRMDDPQPSVVALNFKAPNLTEGRVPGITARTAQGRKMFAVPVGDPGGRGFQYAQARAATKERWKGVDEDALYDLDVEDALGLSEQFQAERLKKNPSKLVTDIASRSPSAAQVLTPEELEAPWMEDRKPLSWFRFYGYEDLADLEVSMRNAFDEEQLRALEARAEKEGGVQMMLHRDPILTDEHGVIIDGTERLLVAKRAGLPTVTVLSMSVPMENPLPILQGEGEDLASQAPMPMQSVEGAGGVVALIGPHVPTVLND